MKFRRDVHTYHLKDELVMFADGSGRLYYANSTAALIWEGIDRGLTIDEITSLLATNYNLSKNRIQADIDGLLKQWQSSELLVARQKASTAPDTRRTSPKQDALYKALPPLPPPNRNGIKSYYQILDSRILIELPSQQEVRWIAPVIAHLGTTAFSQPTLEIEIRPNEDHYVLLHDGIPIDGCDDLKGLAPMILGNMLILAYDQTDCLTGLHAASVFFEGHCILMPALSGSGKSTLTSILVGGGFQYGSDDMVVLTRNEVALRPVPLAMGIKQGAWNLLTPFYPIIDTLRTHRRDDEKTVRYLPPPPNDIIRDPDSRLKVSHIVFPAYQPGSQTKLHHISQADALCRIAEAGYDVQGGLNATRVEQLIQWIAEIPCYTFSYSDLREAVDAFKKLLEK